jgi:hypothetical protein
MAGRWLDACMAAGTGGGWALAPVVPMRCPDTAGGAYRARTMAPTGE